MVPAVHSAFLQGGCHRQSGHTNISLAGSVLIGRLLCFHPGQAALFAVLPVWPSRAPRSRPSVERLASSLAASAAF
jgi:hypothetical protein